MKGFPTIKHFGEDKTGSPKDYQGAREAGPIVAFGQEVVGAGGGGGGRLVAAVTYLDTYSFLHSSGGPVVLLLTGGDAKKASAPSWLSSLAVKYKDGKKKRVSFGFADGSKEAAIAARFGITSFPALIAVAPPAEGAEAYYVKFADKIPSSSAAAVKELKAFIDDVVGGVTDAKLRSPLPPFPPPDVPRKQASVTFSQLTEDNLHSACFGGAKGACVLALVHAPGGELSLSLAAALEAAAKKFRNDPLAFAWLHASGQPEFAAALGVDSVAPSDLPRLLVVKPGKRPRVAALPAGTELSEAAISAFADKVLGGDVTFTAVKGGLPELENEALRAAAAAAEAEEAAATPHDEL